MNYLISFALAFACFSLIAATPNPPTTGFFYINTFTDNACATAVTDHSTPTVKYSATAASSCWTYTGVNNVYLKATDYTAPTLSVTDYTDNLCTVEATTAPLTQQFTCDSSCNQNEYDDNWYTCLYSAVPSAAKVDLATYTGAECVATSLIGTTSTTPDTLATPCWTFDTTHNIFPISWTPSTSTLSAYEFSSSKACGVSMDSTTPATVTPTVGIVCTGKCNLHTLSGNSYVCTYNSSAKLIISLVLSFAIMLILV